jgi:hypothetical protein
MNAITLLQNIKLSSKPLNDPMKPTPNDWGSLIQRYIQQDNISTARQLAEQWVTDCPQELLAHQYAVMTLLFDGDAHAAEQSCHRALALAPELPRNLANLAITYMTQGNLSQGLPLYEARYAKGMVAHDKVIFEGLSQSTQWTGQSLHDKRIFLAGEQGFGDQIQFIRFATELRALGVRKIIVQVRPELVTLIRSMPDIDWVSTERPDPLDYDFWSPLLSVPLQLRLHTIPTPLTLPYLHPTTERADFWKTQLFQWFGSQPKIGLVWAGTPGNSVDGRRSLKTEDMLKLLDKKDRAAAVSLQLGNPGMEQLPEQCKRGMVPLLDLLTDFNETAAVIQNLDLVISVDTAVAHLAGALGKEVWLMLPKGADWRWGLTQSDTPWYPSMQIFRQTRSGDWGSVINAISLALQSRFSMPQ